MLTGRLLCGFWKPSIQSFSCIALGFSFRGGVGEALGTPYDGVNGDAPPERYPFQVAGI